MPSNKARLYVALFARGGAAKMPGKEDTYEQPYVNCEARSLSSQLATTGRYWSGPKPKVRKIEEFNITLERP